MDGSILVADTSNHRIRGSKNLAERFGLDFGGAVGMISGYNHGFISVISWDRTSESGFCFFCWRSLEFPAIWRSWCHVTFWRFRISKLPGSAGLDDPCCSGCFLVVDNLFNSWSFSNLHPFMHGLNWKIMQLLILFQSSSDAIFAIQSHAVPWWRPTPRPHQFSADANRDGGWYWSQRPGSPLSKPMKLPYD